MDPEDLATIKLLDEFARMPREVGPVSLSEEYLRAVEYVESLPKNQSGADKSWIPKAQEQFLRHYRVAQRR
jgi:hypothetical protein